MFYENQVVAVIVVSFFYVAIVIAEIIDRKRFTQSFLCFFGISDYLLAKEIRAVLGDELDQDCGVLRRRIHQARSDVKIGEEGDNEKIQLITDQLLKIKAKKICESVCHLDLARESISGMKRSPGTYSVERIEDVFNKEAESKRKIMLLRKDLNYWIFLAEASGLRTWSKMEGYVAQQLPSL
ncbi:MAG: hypothetical protein ABSE68_02605 [Minisyncoccia bacterium]